MERGFFIVLEGSDGSGKSTQAELLSAQLQAEGHGCVVTEEPGGTPEGKIITDLLLNPDYRISYKTELFLFLADRAEHVEKVIRPSLEAGKIVICSRYFYSTIVYQGIARKLAEIDFLERINLFAVDHIHPDIVFYLDVRPELALSKAKTDTSKPFHRHGGDRIEQEGVNFQKRVREGYFMLADRYADRFIVLDGAREKRDISIAIHREAVRRLRHDRNGENGKRQEKRQNQK